jgi:hypothetical protein
VTETVYCGERENKNELYERIKSEEEKFFPPPSEYKVFYGELHGHCAISDGRGTPELYFLAVCDKAGLDFAALTVHDHGGVGGVEITGKPPRTAQPRASLTWLREQRRLTSTLSTIQFTRWLATKQDTARHSQVFFRDISVNLILINKRRVAEKPLFLFILCPCIFPEIPKATKCVP